MNQYQNHDVNRYRTGGTVNSKYARSNDKMIAGICSLIARETGIDVGLVRIITAVLGLATSGVVVLAYLIAWAVLPAEGESTTFMDKAVREGQKFMDDQKAKKAWRPGPQPGPAPQTPRPQQRNTADPDPFDLYKDDQS